MSEFVLKIRSLRQLILGSFLVALVPLLALLWQSQSDLAQLRLNTESDTVFFVNSASTMQALNSTGLDIERLLLQRSILPNSTLRSLSEDTLNQFRQQLNAFCLQLVTSEACGSLTKQVAQLGNHSQMNDRLVLDAHLSRFKRSLNKLNLDVDKMLSERVNNQQNYMSGLQQKQAWSTAVLTAVSLVLTVFAAQLIVQPVRKLQYIIKAIANNHSRLPAKSSSAPRELLSVERDLYGLNARIQQLEKVRMALLRHASHELKTPLASMKEGCALLAENGLGELNKNQTEVLGLIVNSTDRLNTLIEKLLDYNALLQQAKPHFSIQDTQALIQECIGDNRLVLLQNDREVVVNIDDEEKDIFTDAQLFRRILDNLVSNAIAHGRPNTPITIKVAGNNNNVFVDVSNYGAPISEAERALIFEPFRRGEHERNDKVVGAGLGLSIVSDCANVLGGDITILDVEEVDVCFRVRLNRRAA